MKVLSIFRPDGQWYTVEPLTILASTLLVATLTYVLLQVSFKRTHEPPLVFHWFPFIGSTIAYGIDPFKFFAECQAKVRAMKSTLPYPTDSI